MYIGAKSWHVKGLLEEVVPNAKWDKGRARFRYEDPPVICSVWGPLWCIYSTKIHVDPEFIHAMKPITSGLSTEKCNIDYDEPGGEWIDMNYIGVLISPTRGGWGLTFPSIPALHNITIIHNNKPWPWF